MIHLSCVMLYTDDIIILSNGKMFLELRETETEIECMRPSTYKRYIKIIRVTFGNEHFNFINKLNQ